MAVWRAFNRSVDSTAGPSVLHGMLSPSFSGSILAHGTESAAHTPVSRLRRGRINAAVKANDRQRQQSLEGGVDALSGSCSHVRVRAAVGHDGVRAKATEASAGTRGYSDAGAPGQFIQASLDARAVRRWHGCGDGTAAAGFGTAIRHRATEAPDRGNHRHYTPTPCATVRRVQYQHYTPTPHMSTQHGNATCNTTEGAAG